MIENPIRYIDKYRPINRRFAKALGQKNLFDLKIGLEKNAAQFRSSETTQRYITTEVLPDLLKDPYLNALQIAICMSFVRGYDLDPSIREQIGLPREPNYELPECSPRLYDSEDQVTTISCPYTEEGFRKTHQPIDWGTTEHIKAKNYPFVMYDSLVGKMDGYLMGLCTNAQEFPNGTVFVPNVYYYMHPFDNQKDYYGLLEEILGKALKNDPIDEDGVSWYPKLEEDAFSILRINFKNAVFRPVRGVMDSANSRYSSGKE